MPAPVVQHHARHLLSAPALTASASTSATGLSAAQSAGSPAPALATLAALPAASGGGPTARVATTTTGGVGAPLADPVAAAAEGLGRLGPGPGPGPTSSGTSEPEARPFGRAGWAPNGGAGTMLPVQAAAAGAAPATAYPLPGHFFRVHLTPAPVDISPVQHTLLLQRGGGGDGAAAGAGSGRVGYIRILSFALGVGQQVAAAMTELQVGRSGRGTGSRAQGCDRPDLQSSANLAN